MTPLVAPIALQAELPSVLPPTDTGLSFHDVLSALNPLQYLPVVGTLYRAITGDTISEPLRMAGSLVVSGLMGGPLGVLINLASSAVQKIAGIDPDRIVHDALASVGLTNDPTPRSSAVAARPALLPPPDLAGPQAAGRALDATNAYARAQALAGGA